MGSTKGGGGSRSKPPTTSSGIGSGVAVAPAPPDLAGPVATSGLPSDQSSGPLWAPSQPSVKRSASGLGGSFLAGGSNVDPANSNTFETAARAAGPWTRLVQNAKTTPGRLSIALTGVALSAIVLSLLAGTATIRRSGVANDLRDRKAAVVLDLLSFDASIREADAAATTGFLAGGVEPTKQRKRYDDAIAKATTSLAAVSASIEPKNRRAVATIAAKLPEYTALVATARANNRQGFPSGSAYIRASSTLLREQVLPSTSSLENGALSDFKGRYADLGIGGFLAAFLGVGVLGLVGLLLLQKWMSAKFHRRLNLGLVGSTITLLISMGIALVTASGQMSRASGAVYEGLRPSLDLAGARVRVFSAKADDALGLIGRGNTESSFASARATLLGTTLSYGDADLLAQLNAYISASESPRDLATKTNDYASAIDEANREGTDSVNGTFDAFATNSQEQLNAARNTFRTRMGTAIGTPRNRTAAIVTFLGLSALLAAWGIRMRLREYQ
jgi:hypothetical protein